MFEVTDFELKESLVCSELEMAEVNDSKHYPAKITLNNVCCPIKLAKKRHK